MKKLVIFCFVLLWRVVLVGGTFNNGSNAGLAYSNFNNSSSNRNANIGGQLCLIKQKKYVPIQDITLPLGKKNKIKNSISNTNSRKFCLLQANYYIMKRKGDLYSQIISKENIKIAWDNARKGKKHYKEVKKIAENPEKYINELHEILKDEKFVNSKYEIFERYTGHKLRKIYKLPFYPDRIVHHSIVQIMQPIWMKIFIRDTYSTIPKRGIHDGVKRLKISLKDVANTTYCLKMDVRQYYPSVDHNVLSNILQHKIKDEKLIALLSTIIQSAPGIPIGNYISQWFGNLYLAYFDHYVKEQLKVKYYFRYADDMVLLSNSKIQLKHWQNKIESYLSKNLKLELKSNYQIFPIDKRGIDFLGYRFYHTHTLVRKQIVNNFKKKIKNKNNKEITNHTQSSYWGWFKHADTYNLIKKYFKNGRKS